ncbi:hypothetical protein CARUB_v10012756mg [Capsella rubella]|uniref:Glabrous enhancer-binding protein-like C-terminal domain-containing protein n=1 Tax=Capsella rubella TaxID=81985 RepID=R0GLZ1_9BRAS|nr:hypothetical protein CARUB_v10012756mg [Capsella rubella]
MVFEGSFKVDPKILVLTEKKVEDGVTVKKVEAPMKPVVTEKQEVKRYVENRSSETTNEGDSVNRGKVSEKKEKKKPNFQHVWSEDDEVALLQGLINYKTDTGGEALESTGKSKRVASLKHEDAERVSSSLVRTLVYVGVDELAAQQGLSMIALEDKKRYEEQKALQAREFDFYSEKAKFLHQITLVHFGVDELAAQQGLSRLASEDMKRYEEQWKALQAREFDFYSEKAGLLHQMLAEMVEASRSNV